eukprot:TRINITY_DN7212_c0_g1_i14.p1 TRINITY_DN7212_c0_g1~~TRINITY_DN7212_c0_g1_i14.p1  ORF type:complete len:351 (-),score=85.37 TRINITY_DN7212_c0_g1_i14:62-1114(-)
MQISETDVIVFFFQAEDGIRDFCLSRGLGDVYKRQVHGVGLNMSSGKLMGSNARCLAILSAFKVMIRDYQLPNNEIIRRDLEKKVEKAMNFLKKWRQANEGIQTAFSIIKKLIAIIPPDYPEDKSKEWLIEKIDDFIRIKIYGAQEEILVHGLKLIEEGDTILTFARSHIVETLLVKAWRQMEQEGKKGFNIIVVDNPPYYEGRGMVERLSQQGIEITYTLVNGVAYFLKKVNKIFVGASSVLCNGAVISRIGTAMLSCLAKSYRKPFIVFCETYKFSEKSQLDSLSSNELDDPKMLYPTKQNQEINAINLRYDCTPISNVDLIITEIGLIPPTSVPVVNREFKLSLIHI